MYDESYSRKMLKGTESWRYISKTAIVLPDPVTVKHDDSVKRFWWPCTVGRGGRFGRGVSLYPIGRICS